MATLFVHTGLSARLAANPTDDTDRRARLGIDVVMWLRERDVALFGGDCVEVLSGLDPDLPLPLHQLGIGAMGLTLLDWPCLDGVLALRSAPAPRIPAHCRPTADRRRDRLTGQSNRHLLRIWWKTAAMNRYVLFYESADDVMTKAPAVYPAHLARLQDSRREVSS